MWEPNNAKSSTKVAGIILSSSYPSIPDVHHRDLTPLFLTDLSPDPAASTQVSKQQKFLVVASQAHSVTQSCVYKPRRRKYAAQHHRPESGR